MSIKKQLFKSYTVGEKKPLEEGKIITLRLSSEEYRQLMIMAKTLHISRDSTLIKKLAMIGQNVLISNFGLDFLKWLLDEERITNESKLDNIIVETKENVTQKGISL